MEFLKSCLLHYKNSIEPKPVLYFSLDQIGKRTRELNHLLKKIDSQRCFLLFPVKSFPADQALAEISKFVDGFKISNANEYELVKKHLGEKSMTWLSSPTNQTLDEPEMVDCYGGSLAGNMNSLRVKFCSKASQESRFGISLNQLKDYGVSDIEGIHIHMGGEQNTIGDFKSMIDEINQVLPEAYLNKKLKLNLGGGISDLNTEEIEELLKYALKNTCYDIYLEPGRLLTEEAGIALGEIQMIQVGGQKNYISTNLSHSCHLKWLRGEIKYQIFKTGITREKIDLNGSVTIGGPTSFEGDILVEDSKMNSEVSLGDILVVMNVSGYSYAWNTSFNGVDKAEVIFWSKEHGG